MFDFSGKIISALLFIFCISAFPQNNTIVEDKINERDFSLYEKMLNDLNSPKESVDSNLTLLANYYMGPCHDAVPSGIYLYRGSGAMFQVLDISDPDNPIVISEILTSGLIYDIEIYGNYAFIVAPFTVIDITDPSYPIIVFVQQPDNSMSELYIADHYAFIGGYNSVHIFDIYNPLEPLYLSSVSTFGQFVLAIVSKENYLYISDGYFIHIFNITDKTNPFLVNSFMGGWGGLYVKNNYLYSADFYLLNIFNISDPTELNFVNGIPINGSSVNLTIDYNLAFISLGGGDSSGIAVVNISNPSNLTEPFYIYSKNSPLGYVTCEIQNNYAYISSIVGMDIFSIEDPYSPTYLNSSLTAAEFRKMKIKDGLLYALTTGGLRIFDYKDPLDLKLLGEYQQTRRIDDFEIGGNYIYLLCENSVDIINISNKDSVYKINEMIIPDPLSYEDYGAIILKDSLLIASIPKYQIKFINVNDPYNIFIIDSLVSGRRVHDFTLKGEYLVSAEAFHGLKIYKIASPPYQVDFIDSVTFAALVEGDILYAHTLSIYNISNPEATTFFGSIAIPGSRSRTEIDKSGHYFVVTANNEIDIIDVSNSYNPKIVAYSRGTAFRSVAAANNLIFTDDKQSGIRIFSNDLLTTVETYQNKPIQEQLFWNFPNPFNSNTVIYYKIPNKSFIRITVFDLLGRQIQTLENSLKEGGEYRIEFNGSNLSSGVYFCCLQIDDEVISTIKLQLIK